MGQYNISFVIPVYNEEATISKTAARLRRDMRPSDELLLVDDGSTDNTRSIAKKMQIRIIPQAHEGYGRALINGIRHAKGEVIIAKMDADVQFDVKEAISLTYLLTEYDLVLGWRRQRQSTPYRKAVSFFWNLVVNIMLGTAYHDINGLKVFKKGAINGIPLSGNHWIVDAELIYKLRAAGARILELPVTHHDMKGRESTLNTASFLPTFLDLVKLRLGIL